MDEDFLAAALVLILAQLLKDEAERAGQKVASDFTSQAIARINAKKVAIKGLRGGRVI